MLSTLCTPAPIHGVIPAKAGIQVPVSEIPAFAGMTLWVGRLKAQKIKTPARGRG